MKGNNRVFWGDRIAGVRLFGWQVGDRSDGWLPLSVRDKHGHDTGWHVLKFRGRCVTLGRIRKLA